MKKEKSCGAICFTIEKGVKRFLIVRHKYGGHWSFPKGHVEKGEDEETTAAREVREEAGVEIAIMPEFKGSHAYSPAKGVLKDVVIFVAQITAGKLTPQPEEISEVLMLTYEEALQRLTFDTDKHILTKALNYINNAISSDY